MATSATISREATLALHVEHTGGRSVLTRCSGHVPLASRILPAAPGRVRVALVQTAASILSGDRIAIEVDIGPGAALELTTTSATVAYPAQSQASQSLACNVGAGGRFAWLPEPLVLAEGCDLSTRIEIQLATDAVALAREFVVLGRHGESPGRCESVLSCELDGVPLLRDSIVIDPSTCGSRLQLDGARAFVSLALLGRRRRATPLPGELDLAGLGHVCRALGRDAATVSRRLAAVEPLYAAELWRAAVASTAPLTTETLAAAVLSSGLAGRRID